MKKLLNRKGFTTVELIVVIALLGLLLVIVVPMLSTTDARQNEVREYARSFYSNVQELMIDEKLAGNRLPDNNIGTAKYMLVAAKVDGDKSDYSGVQIYLSYATATPVAGNSIMFNAPDLLEDTTDDDDKVVLPSSQVNTYGSYAEFATSLRKLLLGNERSGWYYAVVDSKFRVISAYFVEGADSTYTALKEGASVKGAKAFTSPYILNGSYAGAWPEELSEKDKVVFQLPD